MVFYSTDIQLIFNRYSTDIQNSLLASLYPTILKPHIRQSHEFFISKMVLNNPEPPLMLVHMSSATKVLRPSELQSLHYRAPMIWVMAKALPGGRGGGPGNARTAPHRPPAPSPPPLAADAHGLKCKLWSSELILKCI